MPRWSHVTGALLAVWEGPQNLVGLALLGLLHLGSPRPTWSYERRRLFIANRWVAVSLGWFVFWTDTAFGAFEHNEATRMHEYGHSIQSRWLGPLYLPLVGVPSVSRVVYALLHWRLTGRRWTGYFDGWPEHHADTLGGVRRVRGPRPR